MSAEQGFLEQLAAQPGDDVTRLVYADWLDEQGDPRSQFLRTEHELAYLGETDARADSLKRKLNEQMRSLSWDWLNIAGKRWDVWLMSVPGRYSYEVLRTLREFLETGPTQGGEIIESAPIRLVLSCLRIEAEMVWKILTEIGSRNTGEVRVAIRLAEEPTRSAMFEPPPTYRMMVVEIYPGMRERLLDILRTQFNWMITYPTRLTPPFAVDRYPTEKAAWNVAQRFAGVARVEMVPDTADRREITLPILRSYTGTGPFTVSLLSFRPEQLSFILQAMWQIRNHYVSVLPEPPIVLRQRVDGAEAERVRRLFAEHGVIEIQREPTG